MLVESFEPMVLAREVVRKAFTGEKGRRRVWWDGERGRWLVWERGVWKVGSDERCFDVVSGVLRDATCRVTNGNVVTERRLGPTMRKVQEVVRFLKTEAGLEDGGRVRWVGGAGRGDAEDVVAFQDVLVHVGESAREWVRRGEKGKYPWVTSTRDEGWLGTVVLPMRWDPEAKGEVWERKCVEWYGEEVEAARERRERYYGACLRAVFRWQRGLMECGMPRSGKGVAAHLLGRLLGGGMYATRAKDLVNDFGAAGMLDAQVVFVAEVPPVWKGSSGESLATLAKVCLGADPTTVNRKYREMLTGVRMRCGLILQGQRYPVVPDDKGGFSAKVLALVHGRSWLDKEDVDLEEKLWAERGAVVRRWMEAQVRLTAETDAGKRWPEAESGRRVLRRMEELVRPADAFLKAMCVRYEGGFVHGGLVREARARWEEAVGLELRWGGSGDRVSDQQLLKWLEDEGSWGLRRGRRGQVRGLWGMTLRKGKVEKDVESVGGVGVE